jgi:adenylate cyclase
MRYDGLQESYWHSQAQRIEALRRKINTQSLVTTGRVIPEEESLVIGSGCRMNLAVLFLDISGSSARPSYTEAEQLTNLRVLNLFFSEMVRICEDYGGCVEKNTGDGLLAYFEDGGGTPADAGTVRAIASGLTMLATNDYIIGPILRNSSIPEIQFRASIDYGPVIIGRLGAPRRFNSIVAIGTPANFASKMLANARAGEIVLGDQAKLQLPPAWQIQYTELATLFTGWNYTLTGAPYPLFRFTGRWSRLV